MFKRTLIPATVVALCSIAATSWAVEAVQQQTEQQIQEKTQTKPQTSTGEQIYGSQLMTRQERIEHRNQLRAAKTLEERERIRAEHHTRMQERARERGVSLPDAPPTGGSKSIVPSPGSGMGPGGGMGYGGIGAGGGK